jgi:CRP-like cAMP-binding protein
MEKSALDRIGAIAVERNVPAKEMVYSPDSSRAVMFVLKKGKVRIFKLSPDGKMITLAILKEGDVFGAMSMVKTRSSGAYAQTLEDSYICAIKQEDLSRELKEMPELALRLIETINQKLAEAEDRIEDLVFRDVPGRIAAVLLKLAEQFGKNENQKVRIDFKITHQELAEMVGATRETITVVLNDFKDEGLIEISEKHITILDLQTLKEWAGRD